MSESMQEGVRAHELGIDLRPCDLFQQRRLRAAKREPHRRGVANSSMWMRPMLSARRVACLGREVALWAPENSSLRRQPAGYSSTASPRCIGRHAARSTSPGAGSLPDQDRRSGQRGHRSTPRWVGSRTGTPTAPSGATPLSGAEVVGLHAATTTRTPRTNDHRSRGLTSTPIASHMPTWPADCRGRRPAPHA
jgi:hypothetical protein